MNRVDESITAAELALGTFNIGIAQQAWGHAGPQGEHHKGQQITYSHGPSPRLVEQGSRGGSARGSARLAGLGFIDAVASGGIIVEPDEEGDGSGDMNEGIDPVNPHHDRGMAQKKALNVQLPEDAQTLLDVNHTEGMSARDVHSIIFEGECSESTTKLICLSS